jgi:hypothetical protein
MPEWPQRAPGVGPEEPRMDLVVFILIGLSLLAIGIAVARLIAALRPPYTHSDKTVTDPILLPEFRAGASRGRDARSSGP